MCMRVFFFYLKKQQLICSVPLEVCDFTQSVFFPISFMKFYLTSPLIDFVTLTVASCHRRTVVSLFPLKLLNTSSEPDSCCKQTA